MRWESVLRVVWAIGVWGAWGVEGQLASAVQTNYTLTEDQGYVPINLRFSNTIVSSSDFVITKLPDVGLLYSSVLDKSLQSIPGDECMREGGVTVAGSAITSVPYSQSKSFAFFYRTPPQLVQ